jgi:DNA ligase 1
VGLWQPLLAATPKKDEHWAIVQRHMDIEPMWGQTKADGVRSLVREGVLVRRKLDPVLNRHLQASWGRAEFNGLDGELALGTVFNPDVYRVSNSNMKLDGSPDMTFYIWDDFTRPDLAYEDRYYMAQERVERAAAMGLRVEMLPNTEVSKVEVAKEMALADEGAGAEGWMLKRRKGFYKLGRSTIREGLVIKVKTMEDQEAIIVGMEELHSNQNEATEDNRGYTKRSSHKENQIPMGTMGALVLRYLSPEWAQKTGKCGSGFTAAQRQWFWDNREKLIANEQAITFKFQRIGSFERPRFPIFKRLYQGS